MIRRALFPLLLAALAACASNDDLGLNRIAASLRGETPVNPRTRARLEALLRAGAPAQLATVVETGQSAGLVRIAQRGTITTWLSIDDVTLAFDAGLLVASRGLGHDLMSADVSQPAALIPGRREGTSTRFHSYLDGEDDTRLRSFVCTVENRGPQATVVGTTTHATTLMAEDCTGAGAAFTNLYWVEGGSGEVLASRQWVGPETGALLLGRLP